MTQTIDLSSSTDCEIEAAVAEHCAGIKKSTRCRECGGDGDGDMWCGPDRKDRVECYICAGTGQTESWWEYPSYLHDTDAVLALLEKTFIAFQWNPDDRCFSYLRKGAHKWEVCFGAIPLENGAFCKGACIALLRSAGVTVKE